MPEVVNEQQRKVLLKQLKQKESQTQAVQFQEVG